MAPTAGVMPRVFVGGPVAGAVTVDELCQFLRLSPEDEKTDTDLLQLILDSSVALVENITGPLVQRTYTEMFDGGGSVIFPLHGPVQSVESVTEVVGTQVYPLTAEPLGGSQAGSYGFTVSSTGGIERRVFGEASMFAPGESNVAITYTAGPAEDAPVAANVRLGVLMLARHLYESTLPAARGFRRGDDSYTPPGVGYALPNFVVELLQPSRRIPGIA